MSIVGDSSNIKKGGKEMNWTNQELRQWAENISEPAYGRVSQKLVREVIFDRANTEELEQGFNREEIRTIWSYVNEIQEVK